MAFKPGKDSFAVLDNVAGSPVNISGYSDSISFPQMVDTHEVSVFGTASKAFVPGLIDGGEISLSGPLDVALGTFVQLLKGAQAAGSSTSTFTWGPGGSVAGQIQQAAEVYVKSFEVSSGVGGRVEYSASLQITGAVTNGTW
jgi:hypothetical protein